MFIMINFGYRSRKIFTIDCLAAALFDCIWDGCHKELFQLYASKIIQFEKEVANHQKKIETEEKKLEIVTAKLKQEQQNNPDKKKDDKKGAKKGGKEAPVASSPLEQEKIDLQKSIEFSKNAILKYADKNVKIKDLQQKLENLKQKVRKEELYVELVDKTGERKFIKTKLKNEANEFLSDRGVYYLCTVQSQTQDQEQIQPLVHEGFPVRTAEQDATIVGEQTLFSIKKDDKGKKGGKKK